VTGNGNHLAILLIATGDYSNFIQANLDSIQKYNHPYETIEFHIYTDDLSKVLISKYKIHLHEWRETKWPYATLLRYEAILRNEKFLEKYSHLLYLDVDVKVNGPLPKFSSNKLLAVEHPGYKNKKIKPLEKRLISKAFFQEQPDSIYVCGGVQGGGKDLFIDAMREMNENIHIDLDKKVIAIWHDESHWNKCINKDQSQVEILGREYCWPEQWQSRRTPGKIIALKKNHSVSRSDKNVYRKFRFFLSDIRMKLIRPRAY
jgi:uncharacterized protein YuzE